MERISGDEIAAFASRLEALDTNTWMRKEGLAILSSKEREELRDKLLDLLRIGKKIGSVELPSTLDQLTRINDALKQEEGSPLHVYPHPWQMFRSLHERFFDDLSRILLIAISSRDAGLFSGDQLFGSAVYENFPSATIDIEEAGKCLALERGTAAVFHLMRVMEVGLKATANALGVPYAPSWESYLRQMKPLLEADWNKKPLPWRAEEPFFRDAYNQLHAVKLAWRNPTMHIVKTYTPDMADDVWSAVKGFMRHLATKLSEQNTASPRSEPLVIDAVAP